MRSLKVVLVGETQVGKTSIVSKFVTDTFDRNKEATVGAALMTKVVTTKDGPVRLQLWDTAGQERFRSLAPMYYRQSSVAVLVYDVTAKTSLDGLEDWAAEIADKAPPEIKIVIVGNKMDLVDDRCVTPEAAQAIARELNAIHYCEASAKTGDGIDEIFQKIVELDGGPSGDILEVPKSVSAGDGRESSGGCC